MYDRLVAYIHKEVGVDMLKINWWAVIVASVVTFGLGALVYGLLAVPWTEAWGIDLAAMNQSDDGWLGFLLSLLSNFVIALVMAFLMARLGVQSFGYGLLFGLLVGGGFMVPYVLTHYNFVPVQPVGSFIDSGYEVLRTAVMGIILGIWPRRA